MATLFRNHAACQQTLIPELQLADNFFSRLKGLLGRRQLGSGEGLLLFSCSSIHTIGMRYAIDAVFLGRENQVIKICREIKPFRCAGALGAVYVLEIAAGEAAHLNIKEGDALQWQA